MGKVSLVACRSNCYEPGNCYVNWNMLVTRGVHPPSPQSRRSVSGGGWSRLLALVWGVSNLQRALPLAQSGGAVSYTRDMGSIPLTWVRTTPPRGRLWRRSSRAPAVCGACHRSGRAVTVSSPLIRSGRAAGRSRSSAWEGVLSGEARCSRQIQIEMRRSFACLPPLVQSGGGGSCVLALVQSADGPRSACCRSCRAAPPDVT